MSHKFFSEIK